jgi:uncharacterized OsmC-like protein
MDVKVTVSDAGDGRFEIRSRKAVVYVDLLPDNGGADDGFRSVELFLGGLGACIAGTIRAYAVNHNVPGFEGVDVIVHSEEASAPERVGRIELEVTSRGDVASGDAERLLVVGGRCKVHNTLHLPPSVDARVAVEHVHG